jgi:hypothetical protein
MGYYTQFEMKLVTDKANAIGDSGFHIYDKENFIEERELATALNRIADMTTAAVDCFDDYLCWDMKWYDHREHMCKLSALYPNLYFKLAGWGEEREDIWEEIYHNGKLVAQKEAEIIYPVWDETDLEKY